MMIIVKIIQLLLNIYCMLACTENFTYALSRSLIGGGGHVHFTDQGMSSVTSSNLSEVV